ncbi:MAG: thioredoxin domain-containing protein, partial [Sandaracinaceae bacterium]|nr:thioredoxin domain-containing protein [Sandaracinaceae bacterium]
IVLAVGAIGLLGVGVVGAAGAIFALRARTTGIDDEITVPTPPLPEPAVGVRELALPGASAERFQVAIDDSPAIGGTEPLVTIVELSDFQCPFCGRARGTLTELQAQYGSDLRVVWRDNPLPFHQDAEPAAQLALEARQQGGDARFWQMHDMLFENQRALSRADLESYASRAGLDLAQVRAALDTHEHRAHIERDQTFAQQIGARGTPTFFINGRKLVGAQPADRFREVIEEERALAQALIARGVSRARLYDAFVRDGLTGPGTEEPRPTRPAQPDPNTVYRVPLGDSPQRGPADALVTVVIFSDFQCPFCSRVTATLDQIEQRYGQDVRFVYKHNPLPFHNDAMPAAEAATEVYLQRGPEAFWRLHDVLFENQRQLGADDLERYAR